MRAILGVVLFFGMGGCNKPEQAQPTDDSQEVAALKQKLKKAESELVETKAAVSDEVRRLKDGSKSDKSRASGYFCMVNDTSKAGTCFWEVADCKKEAERARYGTFCELSSGAVCFSWNDKGESVDFCAADWDECRYAYIRSEMGPQNVTSQCEQFGKIENPPKELEWECYGDRCSGDFPYSKQMITSLKKASCYSAKNKLQDRTDRSCHPATSECNQARKGHEILTEDFSDVTKCQGYTVTEWIESIHY